MCISAVVETELLALTARLGLSLPPVGALLRPDAEPRRRVEARQAAWVLRPGTGGRIVAEAMEFNPYVVRRGHISGDMWVSSLVAANHGLLVVKGFSEWVHARALVALGYIGAQDIHCAFNRSLPQPGLPASPDDRLLLTNFLPQGPMLVPVLFDRNRAQHPPSLAEREFIILSDEAPSWIKRLGINQSPISFRPEAAWEWLCPHDSDVDSAYFEELLLDAKPETYTISLYKSA